MAQYGFVKVYEKNLSEPSSNTDILNIRYQCNNKTLFCLAAGVDTNSMAACANCLDLMAQTGVSSFKYYGTSVWIFQLDLYFGFSFSKLNTYHFDPMAVYDFLSTEYIVVRLDGQSNSNYDYGGFKKYIYLKNPGI